MIFLLMRVKLIKEIGFYGVKEVNLLSAFIDI